MLMLGDLLGIVGLIIAPPVAPDDSALLLSAFFDRTPASGAESMEVRQRPHNSSRSKARWKRRRRPKAIMDLGKRLENLVDSNGRTEVAKTVPAGGRVTSRIRTARALGTSCAVVHASAVRPTGACAADRAPPAPTGARRGRSPPARNRPRQSGASSQSARR